MSLGNEGLLQELETVGLGQAFAGVAVFAPTNAALIGTLAYLGYTGKILCTHNLFECS